MPQWLKSEWVQGFFVPFRVRRAWVDSLIVPAGGARLPFSEETAVEYTDDDGNIRTKENLFMDGPRFLIFQSRSYLKKLKHCSTTLEYPRTVDYFVTPSEPLYGA